MKEIFVYDTKKRNPKPIKVSEDTFNKILNRKYPGRYKVWAENVEEVIVKKKEAAMPVEVKRIPEPRITVEIDDIDASKSAIKYAEAEGIDLKEVEGTGADGKITLPDVKRHNKE